MAELGPAPALTSSSALHLWTCPILHPLASSLYISLLREAPLQGGGKHCLCTDGESCLAWLTGKVQVHWEAGQFRFHFAGAVGLKGTGEGASPWPRDCAHRPVLHAPLSLPGPRGFLGP